VNTKTICLAALFGLIFLADPASAHHLMGGRTPSTFAEGLLSGLGHPIIGLDHLAAVVAIGCLAAAHRAAPALAIGFILMMIAGVDLHVRGTSVPGAEILAALSVIVLGALMLLRKQMSTAAALALFAGTGLVHGYALGESIYGAEQTPLYAYLLGLAIVQGAVALAALNGARLLARKNTEVSTVRLLGAGIAGIGFAIFVQQMIPAA
jgi:urease accessory protein